MRSKQEMLNLILSVAEADDRVRIVIQNGSRVLSGEKEDPFQDFDILFLVNHMASFLQDHSWVDVFGERMVMQLPDEADGISDPEHRFAYLMQFEDGNRIDLSLIPLQNARRLTGEYGPGVVLLDKVGDGARYLTADPEAYIIQRPTPKQYLDACCEFWWIATYVAKGIWRRQLPYAMGTYHICQTELHKMLRWHVSRQHNFSINLGSFDKYLEQYLTNEEWVLYKKTYGAGSYQALWGALFASVELFGQVAPEVGTHISAAYPAQDAERVTAHLQYVRALPADARELYPDRK